jgi:hypothetical protein
MAALISETNKYFKNVTCDTGSFFDTKVQKCLKCNCVANTNAYTEFCANIETKLKQNSGRKKRNFQKTVLEESKNAMYTEKWRKEICRINSEQPVS